MILLIETGFPVKVKEVTLSEMHSSKRAYNVLTQVKLLSKRIGNENAVDGVFFAVVVSHSQKISYGRWCILLPEDEGWEIDVFTYRNAGIFCWFSAIQ